jgi:predicted cupin superfamily sugar epimerase
MHIIHPDGTLETFLIGPNPEVGEVFQLVIPRNCWFAASVDKPRSYALVGCGVAPGFDFSDFELAKRGEMQTAFPQHSALIERYTR